MAHDIRGKVWVVDTSATGLIQSTATYVNGIYVTWKAGSAGTLEFSEVVGEGSAANRKFLSAKTLGATSAGWDQETQFFPFDTIFQNVWLTTATNIDTCYVVTQ